MKIYNEIILKWNDDTNSFDTLYEDSFEYDGPMMLLQGTCTGGNVTDCSNYQAGETGCSSAAPEYCFTYYDNCEHDDNYGMQCSWYDVNNCPEDYGCTWEESITGCTDSSALNYNPEATVDDGSCEYECLTMCGDVNGDGTVDVLDIVLLMEYIISEGTLPLTGEALACANVNGDGIVDILDVVAMISYVTGQTNNLYCDLSDGPIDPHPLVNDPPVAQITIVQ